MFIDIFSRFIQKRLGWSQEAPLLFISFFAIAVPAMISTAQAVVAEDFDINSPYECYNCHLLVTPPEERTPDLYDTDVIDPHHSPYAADYDPSVPDDWRHDYNVYFPDAPTSCGFCHSNTYENQGGGIRQGVACGECHLYGACPSTIWQIGLPQNDPPELGPIGDQMGYEDVLLTFTVTATDPNSGDTLTFSASNLPPGASFDPTTGRFSWVPPFDSSGVYEDVEFSVQDDGTPLGLDTELITITVGNVNRPPVFFPVEPQEVLENELLLFTVEAIDPDGDDIAYSVDPLSLPAGAVFDPSTLTFSWWPDRTQEGNYTVVFFATDNGTPSTATGETAVFVTVGDVPTATELVDVLLTTISLFDLDKAVVKSYLANLKKLHAFIHSGKLGPAVNQVDAFIGKVEQDIVHGNIDAADGDHLIFIANDLIVLLDG